MEGEAQWLVVEPGRKHDGLRCALREVVPDERRRACSRVRFAGHLAIHINYLRALWGMKTRSVDVPHHDMRRRTYPDVVGKELRKQSWSPERPEEEFGSQRGAMGVVARPYTPCDAEPSPTRRRERHDQLRRRRRVKKTRHRGTGTVLTLWRWSALQYHAY